MSERVRAINSEMSRLYQVEDDLYHRYAMFFGLSNPMVWVLYGLCEDEDRVLTQNDLASTWLFPKQTINYTVSTLSKRGWVELRQLPVARNSKAVILTDEGRRVCEEKILPLMRAEELSISRMGAEECELLLTLMKKQLTYFEEEITKITEGGRGQE